ncbi:IS110 family transposase [Polaribacter sp. Asnod6-C07]|uniref:IS110 family transposase n=1 Tax=Polaribacter sp. Asnod6-C07 TaxID=3160582 RepID=UPI003867A46F
MKNYSLIIGIDISKSKLDIIGINANSETILQHQIIDNTKTKINLFLKKIINKYSIVNVLVTFENTGIYGYLLACSLEKLNMDYCNLSALEIHKSVGIKRGKSDKKDALVIAQYAITNKYKLKLSVATEKHLTELKLLHTQREKITKAIRQFQNNKETELFLPKKMLSEFLKSNTSILKNLRKNLKLIDAQILNIIKTNDVLKTDYELTQSIPGIGPQTATYLLIVTKGFTCFENARQLACYAGVAPFPYQSGSSIKGRNKVSHLADKKLKSLLNMCALNAKKHDHQMNTYFENKVKEGKNKMLILNNIRNKLLHRVFAVIKRQQPYVNIHNFAA